MADLTPRLLNSAQAATYLGTTEAAIRSMVQRRRIPFVRQGPKSIRFDLHELDRWIADNTVEAVS